MLDATAFLPFLANAVAEDLGKGDATVQALVPPTATTVADLVAKERGVLAGLPLLEPTSRILDGAAAVEPLAKDGDAVEPGQRLAVVRGRARAVLSTERTGLNILRRLSGVASLGQPDGMGGVAWWAHIGGFVAGIVGVVVFSPPARPPRVRELPL